MDLQEAGQAVKALEGRPVLRPDLALYWRAFWDLTNCRAVGFAGPGPIPWVAIHHWAVRYDITGDAFERLTWFVGRVDEAFVGWVKENPD